MKCTLNMSEREQRMLTGKFCKREECGLKKKGIFIRKKTTKGLPI